MSDPKPTTADLIGFPIHAAHALTRAWSHLQNLRDTMRELNLDEETRANDDAAIRSAMAALYALAVDCDPNVSSRAYIEHAHDAVRHAAHFYPGSIKRD
jgi:hypothetical protein